MSSLLLELSGVVLQEKPARDDSSCWGEKHEEELILRLDE